MKKEDTSYNSYRLQFYSWKWKYSWSSRHLLFSVLSIYDLQKVTTWEDNSNLREYKIGTKHQSQSACSCSFGKGGERTIKKAFYFEGITLLRLTWTTKWGVEETAKKNSKEKKAKWISLGSSSVKGRRGMAVARPSHWSCPRIIKVGLDMFHILSNSWSCLAQRESRQILV